MKIQIKTKELDAISKFASKDESRFVLNGVNVELKPNEKPLMVATDGRVLGAIQAEISQQIGLDANFTMPIKFVNEVIKIAKLKKSDEITILKSRKTIHARIKGFDTFKVVEFRKKVTKKIENKNDSFVLSREIDGAFPKWRQVVPSKFTGCTDYCLSPKLLTKIIEAINILCPKNPAMKIKFSDSLSACVATCERPTGFMSVVMPMRFDGEVSIPNYAK